jgi:hypothetical protein
MLAKSGKRQKVKASMHEFFGLWIFLQSAGTYRSIFICRIFDPGFTIKAFDQVNGLI